MELALKRPARFLPRNPRHGVDIETALVLGDDRVFPIRMENISSHGFMARCTIELAAGSWLGVELPGHGIVRARVRWWDDDEAGFQFRTPIDLHRYGSQSKPPTDRSVPGGHASAGRLIARRSDASPRTLITQAAVQVAARHPHARATPQANPPATV